MSPINLSSLLLVTSVICGCAVATGGDVAQVATSGAYEKLVKLVSRLRFELRRIELKSVRCSALADQLDANEATRSLLADQTRGYNTQVRRLIAASSLLEQHPTPLTSLVAFLDECANELGALPDDFESVGAHVRAWISAERAVRVDAGALVGRATAELTDENGRLATRVSELEGQPDEANELAKLHQDSQVASGELAQCQVEKQRALTGRAELERRLTTQVSQLESIVKQLGEAEGARMKLENELNGCRADRQRELAIHTGEMDQCKADKQRALGRLSGRPGSSEEARD